MKRIILTFCVLIMAAFSSLAQNTQEQVEVSVYDAETVAKDAYVEFPYSKVVFATKNELLAQKFKYDSYRNQMRIQHTNGVIAVLNVLSDTYVPAKNDYKIVLQYGAEDVISSVRVTFYDKSIYEHILLFASDKGCDVKEAGRGTGKSYTFNYGGYTFNLDYTVEIQHVSNTTTTTSKDGKSSHSTTSSHDVSYDQYVYTILTGNEPESEFLSKQSLKKAKRAAKGKKASDSGDFL